MDHTIIPQEWKKFLGVIQSVHPQAIIAGGALRDTICDNPVKDVDIFIPDMDPASILSIDYLSELLGLPIILGEETFVRDHIKLSHNIKSTKQGAYSNCLVEARGNPDYITASNSEEAVLQSFINYIVDVQYNGTIYQLIFIEYEPVSYVYNDFDFGICKVYFDGLELVVTEEFWYDMENKQLTCSGAFGAGQMLHTMFVHRPNLIKKFPGWKVVIDDVRIKTENEMPLSYQEMFQVVPESEQQVTVGYVWVGSDGVKRQRKDTIKRSEMKPWHKECNIDDNLIVTWPTKEEDKWLAEDLTHTIAKTDWYNQYMVQPYEDKNRFFNPEDIEKAYKYDLEQESVLKQLFKKMQREEEYKLDNERRKYQIDLSGSMSNQVMTSSSSTTTMDKFEMLDQIDALKDIISKSQYNDMIDAVQMGYVSKSELWDYMNAEIKLPSKYDEDF